MNCPRWAAAIRPRALWAAGMVIGSAVCWEPSGDEGSRAPGASGDP